MSKILITGGAGFLGHHLVEHLLKNTKDEIIILDRLNYAGNLNLLKDISVWEIEQENRVSIVYHDLQSPITPYIDNSIGDFDYLIHLASETHVDSSLIDCRPFVASNVLGTANLLEWLKNKKFIKGIIFSTDEVFGSAKLNESFNEIDILAPSNPYAAAKAGEELLAYSFIHAFNLNLIIVRSMNMFGERQHIEKFIPKTIRNILLNEKIVLHGVNKDITSLRHWIHCREVSNALYLLLMKDTVDKYYHIVGTEMSCYEISQILMETLDKISPIEYLDFHSARPGHDFRYAMKNNNLKLLNWKLNLDTKETLRTVTKWYAKNQKWLQI